MLAHTPKEMFYQRHQDFVRDQKLDNIDIWVNRIDHVECPETFVVYLLGTWDRFVEGKQYKGKVTLYMSDEDGEDAVTIGECLDILERMVTEREPCLRDCRENVS